MGGRSLMKFAFSFNTLIHAECRALDASRSFPKRGRWPLEPHYSHLLTPGRHCHLGGATSKGAHRLCCMSCKRSCSSLPFPRRKTCMKWVPFSPLRSAYSSTVLI